jgi:hypothetical protein
MEFLMICMGKKTMCWTAITQEEEGDRAVRMGAGAFVLGYLIPGKARATIHVGVGRSIAVGLWY